MDRRLPRGQLLAGPLSPATIPIHFGVTAATGTIYASVGAISGGARPRGVAVIDGQTDAVTATIGLPGRPEDVAVNPATNFVYVVNRKLADIWKISGTTAKVSAKISLPGPSSDVATDTANNTVYITPNSGGTHDLTVLKGGRQAPRKPEDADPAGWASAWVIQRTTRL